MNSKFSNFWAKGAGLFLLVAVAVFSFSAGAYTGFFSQPEVNKVEALTGKATGQPETTDFSLFWRVWNVLNDRYVDGNSTTTKSATTDKEKVYGAIEGLVDSLGDPYTVFLPPKDKQRFEADIKGSFGGVGMELGMKDGQLTVVTPLPDSPAEKAGIRAGDKVVGVNGSLTANMTIDEAVDLIRGEPGTSVKLTLIRGGNGKSFDVSVVRQVIKIPTIEAKAINNQIYYIRLYNFSAPSASLFAQKLKEFYNLPHPKLIIDVRSNPGGFLDSAVEITSWFVPKGQPVVIEDHGTKKPRKVFPSAGPAVASPKKFQTVVLVDGGSASASEIFAGALREYGVAKLIGQKTFGKGSVQELVSLPGGTALKVTIARWVTPKGHYISQEGLNPDITVLMTEEDIKADRDPQLDRAVKFLTTGK